MVHRGAAIIVVAAGVAAVPLGLSILLALDLPFSQSILCGLPMPSRLDFVPQGVYAKHTHLRIQACGEPCLSLLPQIGVSVKDLPVDLIL